MNTQNAASYVHGTYTYTFVYITCSPHARRATSGFAEAHAVRHGPESANQPAAQQTYSAAECHS